MSLSNLPKVIQSAKQNLGQGIWISLQTQLLLKTKYTLLCYLLPG